MADKRTEEQKRIDTEVASKVMGLVPCEGWAPMNLGSAGGPALRKDCAHEDHACYPTASIGGAFGSYYGCPAYSTNIKFAMEVVERLSPTQEEYNAGRKSCRFIMRQQDNGSWSIEARSPFLTSYNVPVFADSASLPEAICKAALSVVNSIDG